MGGLVVNCSVGPHEVAVIELSSIEVEHGDPLVHTHRPEQVPPVRKQLFELLLCTLSPLCINTHQVELPRGYIRIVAARQCEVFLWVFHPGHAQRYQLAPDLSSERGWS